MIIPARDEASTIGRCLASLQGVEGVEVIVVANGCTDDTVEVSCSFADRLPGIQVIELREPGKVGALNAGDAAAHAFPRIYLDADIELGLGTLQALIAVLTTPDPRVASPAVRFDLSRSTSVVRAFYRAFVRMSYVNENLIGLGVYGLSERGRAQFAEFPDVIADDLFVQQAFWPAQRLTCAGTFVVRAPRTLQALVSVRTRVARGNYQLERRRAGGTNPAGPAGSTATSSARSLVAGVTSPRLASDVCIYVAVTLVCRLRACFSGDQWLRDDSTRELTP